MSFAGGLRDAVRASLRLGPAEAEAAQVTGFRRAPACATMEGEEYRMVRTIQIPLELARFQLPEAVQARLQKLLDRQDAGQALTPEEREEAEGLVELAEFLSLLHLRALRANPPS
jgi:hypothetical protein